jgi:hypothetical protein
MLLALAVAALVLMALLCVLALQYAQHSLLPRIRASVLHARLGVRLVAIDAHDPGRERRAEQRARALLRSCVNDEEWAMYSELGFLRMSTTLGECPGAYLIYPHKPILAYDPSTSTVLGEYCVEFPDHTRPYGSTRLPDADDVLAKWIALTADERALIDQANMHLPGRQIALAEVRRDLARLAHWEHTLMNDAAARRSTGKHERFVHSTAPTCERAGRCGPAPRRAGSVPAL